MLHRIHQRIDRHIEPGVTLQPPRGLVPVIANSYAVLYRIAPAR